MRGLRSVGLLALYVGAQVVALLLALPFRAAGLQTTSNPNSATDPILIIVFIVVAGVTIPYFAAKAGGAKALRWLILVWIAAALDITLSAAFALVTPAPFYLPPSGAGMTFDVAVVLAGVVAVTLLLALLIEPQWYIVDTAGFIAAGSIIALIGISFGILPVFILLIALAVYDAIAVYGTKHMLSLADVVTEMKLPILMVMPSAPGFDYTRSARLSDTRQQPTEQREAMFMGLGDVVIPGILVVSAFIWLPTAPHLIGVGANLVVAIAALLGSLAGYSVLMSLVLKGNPQAGLPLLNGGGLAGYIVAYLLLFHSFSLGLSFSL
jgi:presenilin-like A22 family membrane protease